MCIEPTSPSQRKDVVSSFLAADKYALDYKEIKFEAQIGEG